MRICQRYLVFPISRSAQERTVVFCVQGRPVYDLTMRLTCDLPDFYAFVDMERFRGQEVSIEAEGMALPSVKGADCFDHRAPFDPSERPPAALYTPQRLEQ